LNTKADVYITESNFNSLTAQDFIRIHLLFCNLGGASVSIRHGEVRGNTDFGTLNINDGPNAGVGDTLFIVGNTFLENRGIYWQNDDNYFWIANNKMVTTGHSFQMNKHHFSSVVNNNLINNYFSGGASQNTSAYYSPVRSTSTGNISNVYLYNNILESRYNSNGFYNRALYASGGSGSMQLFYNYCKGYGNGTAYGGTKVVGNFGLAYNAALLTVDADGRCNDATYCVDKGSTALQYYDIDMTRNDIGTYGGPYSIDNYLEVGTGNARVYDLNMPFEIWSGQTPQVKAEATHTK
jgi:hypothetical protein